MIMLGMALCVALAHQVVGGEGGQRSAEKNLSFYAPFDGSPTAAICMDGPSEPLVARGIKFVPGICGEAVFVGGHGGANWDQLPLLEYDGAKHFSSEAGTVSFWVRPDWDGVLRAADSLRRETYYLWMATGGGEGADSAGAEDAATRAPFEQRIGIFMWKWLRCDLFHKQGAPPVSLASRCRTTWMRGDWWHLAFAWDEKGLNRLYVNGVPKRDETKLGLKDIHRFYVGCAAAKTTMANFRANAAFDELKIYRRALTADEIVGEFQRLAPVDFSLERRYLRAETEEKVAIEISPANKAAAPVRGAMSLRVLRDADGQVVAEKKMELQLSGCETATVSVGKLPVGAYRMECVLRHQNGAFQRSFPLTVYQQNEAPKLSSDPVKLGECIARVDCTDSGNGFVENGAGRIKDGPDGCRYREAGAQKSDRFSYEVNIPQADGSPVMLEITWPDDRERSMALYMFPRANEARHRDRLEGGIQSGGEYPVSNSLQKARYLFYPAESQYLFEARTLVSGLPAAVSKIEIYRLAERLPKLPIHLPEGAPARALGHMDEDQSFQFLLAPFQDSGFKKSSLPHGYPIQVFELLLDYFDYTGQNVLSYPLARYGGTYLDHGPINNQGDNLMQAGWCRLLLDMMEKRGQQLVANINLFVIPDRNDDMFSKQSAIEPELLKKRTEDGFFLRDKTGKVVPFKGGWPPGLGNNPLHPVVRARFLEIVQEILRRYGKHPSFKGIDVWCSQGAPFLFSRLDDGYDDFTVGLFEKETGIKAPATGGISDRCERRYNYLTSEKRVEWLAWRAKKTTELFRDIDAMARKVRPDLQCFISLGLSHDVGVDFVAAKTREQYDVQKNAYECLSLDFNALKALPSLVVGPQKSGSTYRWLKHWYGRETIAMELSWNVDKYRFFQNGPRSAASIYLIYFESFMNSLKPDIYKAYFQNADAKAHGRYFLQDLTVVLAAHDPSQILIGGQPLGSAGRDEEMREFSASFRALPSGDYLDVEGMRDPVAARFLPTEHGVYLYAVSLLWTPTTAVIELPDPGMTATDLRDGRALHADGSRLTVELKPFELRSFLLTGARLKKADAFKMRGRSSVSGETRTWYEARLAEAEKDVAFLEKNEVNVVSQRQRVDLVRQLLGKGFYADAHRLLFSKIIRDLPEFKEISAHGYLQKRRQMIEKGEYAVRCGGTSFYQAVSGRLFFPDNKYETGGYGHDGSYKSIERSIDGIVGTSDPQLFAAEAFGIEAYRFTVKPGKYTVRLYVKIGYKPGAKPGVFVFNLDIEKNRVLSGFDVFAAAKNNFNEVVVCEFKDIAVKDGVLDLEFSVPPNINPKARMCNAIEVIPQP